jgi:alkaline phosphatase D
MSLSRRHLLTGAAATGAALTLPPLSGRAAALPTVVRRDRLGLPSGIASGDVTPHSAVLWSRTDRPARMVVELTSRGDFSDAIRLRGPVTGPDADFTAQLPLRGCGRGSGTTTGSGSPATTAGSVRPPPASSAPPGRRRPVRFVWTGDTAGQGWGSRTAAAW